MNAKTTAERQRAWRAAWKEKGYDLVPILCHQDDRDRLKRYALRLRDKRQKEQQP